jgi:hypothetical protein
MSKKFKKISFIVLDIIILAFFGFYLTINLKYKDADNYKEDMSQGDFRLQSLFGNQTTNGGGGGNVTKCSVSTVWPGTWSIGESHSFSVYRTPSSATGTATWSGIGACSMSGSTATCNSKGTCTAKATFGNGVSCTGSVECACTEWTGPKTVNHVNKNTYYSHTKSWADANDKEHYYNTNGWTNCNEDETDCTNTMYYTRNCGNGSGGGGSSTVIRNYTLKVNHYIVGTKTMAQNNCTSSSETKTEGSSYSTHACSTLRAGWRLHHTDGDPTSGTMNSDKTVNYYYE